MTSLGRPVPTLQTYVSQVVSLYPGCDSASESRLSGSGWDQMSAGDPTAPPPLAQQGRGLCYFSAIPGIQASYFSQARPTYSHPSLCICLAPSDRSEHMKSSLPRAHGHLEV